MAFDTGNYQLTYDGSGWSTGPVIDSYGVASIACASAKLCVEGDIQGYVRRYNGRAWGARVDLSSRFNPIGGYVDAMSCPSTSFCMAGDNSGHAYISTDGARTWSSPVTSGLYDLASLSCASAHLCVGSDIYGSVAVFDKTGWGTAQSNLGTGASCARSTCLVVGVNHPDTVERFDGTAWTEMAVPSSAPLVALACSTPSSCSVGDRKGAISHFNGTDWGAPTPVLSGGIDAVDCDTSDLCVALGSGVDVSINVDADGWSAAQAAEQAGGALVAVSCPSPAMCMAVDNAGNAIAYRAPNWSAPVRLTRSGALVSVSCPSTTFCAALDDTGSVRTYDGTAWSHPRLAADADAFPTTIACSSHRFCVVGTQSGYMYDYDGRTWTSYGEVQQSTTSISCRDRTCVAVGGGVSHFDGTTWSAEAYVGKAYLTHVSCASDTSCVAIDTDSKVHTLSDGSWGRPFDSGLTRATDIACQSDGDCTIVDSLGDAAMGQGAVWSDPMGHRPCRRWRARIPVSDFV